MKVTVVATEPVEVQVRVEDGDPGVNIRGLEMLGIAVAGGGGEQEYNLTLSKKTGRAYYC